ncbi:MAG TPA: ATP-binding protein [Fibrobacteria bacterium]|nr:ATP-binding protein [Fibrobacteria bacterium]
MSATRLEIAAFRRENLDVIAACFLEILKLAKQMRLLKVSSVSVDGTKLKANASKNKSVRYDRVSLLITSNQQFSKWEVIFKDPMTTEAAIDRLIHHSVILELQGPSNRMEKSKARKGRKNHDLTR